MGCGKSKQTLKLKRADSPTNIVTEEPQPPNSVDFAIAHVCLYLCKLANELTDEDDFDVSRTIVWGDWTISKRLVWTNPSIEEKLDSLETPLALTGLITHAHFKRITSAPFIAFRGQTMNPHAYRVMTNANEFPFMSTKGFKVGKANGIAITQYEELRQLDLVPWFRQSIQGKNQFFVTGHGSGGSLATLFCTDLIVDNSVIHKSARQELKKTMSQQTLSSHSPSRAHSASFRAFPPKSDPTEVLRVDEDGLEHTALSSAFVRSLEMKEDEAMYNLPKFLLITFGAPRVFCTSTAVRLQRLKFRESVFRYVLPHDMLAASPLEASKDFSHFGDAVRWNASRGIWERLCGLDDLSERARCSQADLTLDASQLDEYALCFETSFGKINRNKEPYQDHPEDECTPAEEDLGDLLDEKDDGENEDVPFEAVI